MLMNVQYLVSAIQQLIVVILTAHLFVCVSPVTLVMGLSAHRAPTNLEVSCRLFSYCFVDILAYTMAKAVQIFEATGGFCNFQKVHMA